MFNFPCKCRPIFTCVTHLKEWFIQRGKQTHHRTWLAGLTNSARFLAFLESRVCADRKAKKSKQRCRMQPTIESAASRLYSYLTETHSAAAVICFAEKRSSGAASRVSFVCRETPPESIEFEALACAQQVNSLFDHFSETKRKRRVSQFSTTLTQLPFNMCDLSSER